MTTACPRALRGKKKQKNKQTDPHGEDTRRESNITYE